MSDERWNKAIEHAREAYEAYTSPYLRGAGTFAAAQIVQMIELYEAGDRSEALVERLEGIEL